MADVDARKLLAQAKDLSTRYARRMSPDEAADLVGEALARGLERPPADGKMAPWLERIARNLLVDRWRRTQVSLRFEAGASGSCAPEPSPSPEELAVIGERRRAIRRSLARLPRDQRQAIIARYYLGDARIPEGLSATTFRTRLHRALTRLRALTRGLLALAPPARAFQWMTMAANPAAVALLAFAHQASPAVPAARPTIQARVADIVHLARKPPAALPPARGPALRPAIPPVPPPLGNAATGVPSSPAVPNALPPPVQRYTFDNDQIEGDLQRPDDIVVPGSTSANHSSLIEIPSDFVASILKSVEDL